MLMSFRPRFFGPPYSSSLSRHTAKGTHITQCYLPPGRGDILQKVGTRTSTDTATDKSLWLMYCERDFSLKQAFLLRPDKKTGRDNISIFFYRYKPSVL